MGYDKWQKNRQVRIGNVACFAVKQRGSLRQFAKGSVLVVFVSIFAVFEFSPYSAAVWKLRMNSTSRAAVETIGLSKRFGSFDALADLQLTVPAGSIFGLLGPNGAGKTTFIRLLLGFLYPTSGQSLVLGRDPVTDPVGVRQLVSYLPAEAVCQGKCVAIASSNSLLKCSSRVT